MLSISDGPSSVTMPSGMVVMSGASLTGSTVMVTVSLAVSEAPPLLPRSSISTVRVTSPVSSVSVWKVTPWAAMKALMSAIVPDSMIALVPSVTVTPDPLVAVIVPLSTLSVTSTVPLPASASAKEMPVIAVAVSSVTVIVAPAGTVITGASLTVVMATVVVSVPSAAPPVPCVPLLPSFTVQTRSTEAGGASLELA